MNASVWAGGAAASVVVLLAVWSGAGQPAVQPRLDRPRVTPAIPVEPAKPEPAANPPGGAAPASPSARTGWTDLPTGQEVDLPMPNRGMEPPGTGQWLSAYMEIVLPSGRVDGSVAQRGREKLIEVYGLEHMVEGDAYGLVRVTIGADQAIPDLLGLMGQSGQGASATISFYGTHRLGTTGGTGIETLMFTIVLDGVRVERVRLTRNMNFNEIGLGYDTITYRSAATGHEASATR